MNWRRGLFRAWAILSIVWMGFVLWYITSIPFTDLILKYGSQQNSFLLRWDMAVEQVQNVENIVWLLAPPLAALVVGRLMLWVFSGFQKTA